MVDFNPFLPEVRANPYPLYKELREQDPVHWAQLMQVWVLTRYDDVFNVLRDHGRFSSERNRATNPIVQQMESFRQASGPVGRAPTMLSLDPPAHTRLRNLVNKAFTPRMVERIRPQIQEIADELLAGLPQRRSLDVISDLAVPLPVIVIAQVLGVPREDRERFKAWSSDIAGSLGGPFQPGEALERARQASVDLAAYFHEQIEWRRRKPQDDLLSGLIAAEEQGDLLSEDEMLATCVLLLVAGNETTTNLIGTGVLHLLESPEQLRRLVEEPALIPSAVEEMLRYDSPAQLTSRVAVEPIELRGKRIEPGQVVLAVLGAANRDPAQFPDPDRFDVARQSNRHLAFGYGIHYCLGAPLALAEAQVAIATLVQRMPEMMAAFEAPDWGPSFILRGLHSLPVVGTVN